MEASSHPPAIFVQPGCAPALEKKVLQGTHNVISKTPSLQINQHTKNWAPQEARGKARRQTPQASERQTQTSVRSLEPGPVRRRSERSQRERKGRSSRDEERRPEGSKWKFRAERTTCEIKQPLAGTRSGGAATRKVSEASQLGRRSPR